MRSPKRWRGCRDGGTKTWAVERVPGLREVVLERLRWGWSPA
ncbi:hypothetical protein OG559_30570 [Micromonospora sp. NBC_01405]